MEKHVNTSVWHACAGVRHMKTLASSSTVYYFPQGHVENYGASTAVKALCANLPATKCEIVSVEFLADQATDEVYARILLTPHVPGIALNPRPEIAAEVNRLAKGFLRRLDTCDLSRELSVFDKQLNVNEIFMKKEDMYLKIGDIHGKVWNFWKTYNHAQSCHSLTSGWPEFVASKQLSAGDDLLFMKTMDGEITVGVRRRPVNMNGAFLCGIQEDKLPNGGRKCSVEDLAEAMGKAFAKLEFQVLYYPSVGRSCMIHDAKEVEKSGEKPLFFGVRVSKESIVKNGTARVSHHGIIKGLKDNTMRWCGSSWKQVEVAWDLLGVEEESTNAWEIEPVTCTVPQQKRTLDLFK